MEQIHFDVWQRCRDFVGDVCKHRDASHGLLHMEKVAELAVLLFLMSRNTTTTTATTSSAEVYVDDERIMLYRVIIVAMLHDVADHKYDVDGTLFARVEDFVRDECARWPSSSLSSCVKAESEEELHTHILTAISAISYSTENKRGMRWFVETLAPCWITARDFVSDADKLEAIGEDGLFRCYEYTCSTYQRKSLAARNNTNNNNVPPPRSEEEVQQLVHRLQLRLLADVVEHFHEKLNRLYTVFVQTPTGKFVGAPRHASMSELLHTWQKEGPPPVSLYWRNAAEEYVE